MIIFHVNLQECNYFMTISDCCSVFVLGSTHLTIWRNQKYVYIYRLYNHIYIYVYSYPFNPSNMSGIQESPGWKRKQNPMNIWRPPDLGLFPQHSTNPQKKVGGKSPTACPFNQTSQQNRAKYPLPPTWNENSKKYVSNKPAPSESSLEIMHFFCLGRFPLLRDTCLEPRTWGHVRSDLFCTIWTTKEKKQPDTFHEILAV